MPQQGTSNEYPLCTVLGFKETSNLVGHYETEEIVEEMKEKDREERGTGMKVKKQKK